MQGVYPKQSWPSGHSELSPLSQGSVQDDDASSQVVPQKNDPLSLQGVLAKQLIPSGQSWLEPLSHGNAQFDEASSKVVPQ
mmetsp:Transcript_31003/g.61540  ORF Transcript_31003/g.61540 Transcript_31003/m.61540 type:complete len:81 (-) Transcript_31003:1375-1617(-)